ncbi:MAG TPA: cytochrome c [Blastocatellia bacterium]|nr:cytochrome c [Blastocatellia bacterium]
MIRRISILLMLASALAGCGLRPAGNTTPLQVHPDMDNQPKYKAQSASAFFADGRANRPPVPGTIAQGHLNEDDQLTTGKDASGNLIKNNPLPVDEALLLYGQERFNINCALCHGRLGDGTGMVKTRSFGALAPANLQDTRLREVADGHIFDVITNGIRTMQPLRSNVPVRDRWAIVAYVRALQRSQYANLKDVPAGTEIKPADPSATPIPAAPAASPAAGASPGTAPASSPATAPTRAASPANK